MTDVFISYSKFDKAIADALATDLNSAGFSVWYDYDIVGGQSFTKAIMAALDASKVVIVIWSSSSAISDFVVDEASRAKQQEKLITTRLEDFDVSDLPIGFGQFQCYPVTDRKRLMQSLEQFGLCEPDSTELHQRALHAFESGYLHYSNGEIELAIARFSRAIELNPAYAIAYNNRGELHRRSGNFDRAMADCDKAIELAPSFAAAYGARAAVHYETGNYSGAIADCNKAIALDPNNALSYNTRAAACNEVGDHVRAIGDCDTAIELDPTYAQAYNTRGTAHLSNGDYTSAITDFDRAIELDPDYSMARKNRQIAVEARDNQ
ncbi:MAG: tetratricopeptide repeat protein [Hyphomicrobiaceae bacterium]